MSIAQYKSVRVTLEQKVRHSQAKKDVVRELVKNMLAYDVPIAARYDFLDVIRILQENCLPFDPGLEALIRGLSILEKYGKNLLRHERPPLWRVVRLSNTIFKEEVDVIKGAREILGQLGYTKLVEDGLSYPDNLLIPDIPVVTSVTTDILLLRMELIMLAHREHRQENAFYSYIPTIEIKMVQEKMGAANIPNEQDIQATFSLPMPPSYQQVLGGAGINVQHMLNVPTEARVVENGHNRPVLRKVSETADHEIDIDELCDLCGQKKPDVKCNFCDGQEYCFDCNELWHNNPKRKSHKAHLIYLAEVATNSSTQKTNGVLGTNEIHALREPSSRLLDSVRTVEIGSLNGESEFTMQMNRKAIELMEISDPMRKRQRLMESLNQIDDEAARYRKFIETLPRKANDKPHLVKHINSKIEELQALKEHLKAICGVDIVPPEPNPPTQNVEQNETAVFHSVQFHNMPSNSLSATHHSMPVAEATLIDLEPQEEPSQNYGELQSQHNSSNAQLLSTMLSSNDFQMHQKHESGDNEVQSHQPITEVHMNEEPGLELKFHQPIPKTRRSKDLDSESQFHQPVPKARRNRELNKELQFNQADTKALKTGEPQSHVSSQLESLNIGDNLPLDFEMNAPLGENEFSIGTEIPFTTMESQMKDFLVEPTSQFLTNLSPTELQKKIKKEEHRYQTTQFLDLIRAGDAESFRPEQVEVAIHEIDKESSSAQITPNTWLQQNWVPGVQSFIALAKANGFKISPENAEDVLLEADNVFEKGLELITTTQDEQIYGIAEQFGFDAAKRAFIKHKTDRYLALASLQKTSVTQIFLEFQQFDKDNDQVSELKMALQIDDEIVRKNAITAQLHLNDGMYAQAFNHLLNSMPADLKDTLLEDAVEAVTGNGAVPNVEDALHYLDNECMICTEKFPRSKITCLSACGENECRYCLSCLEQHLTICVNDKNIRDIVCPVCSKPEYGSDEETKTNFINHVDVILRNMPNSRVHEIFQQKLRDFTLMRLPNFRWCSHCSGGFQFDAIDDNIKMLCPFCRKHTCYKCKKQWEPQHDGITCEQFQKWKEANDPEFQAAGLARHLRENGIDCPDCKFRYALAKGGCMHFKCTQCSHEFCSGCSQAFKHGKQCGKLPSCVNRGLHAHHPRDCLFFLRDAEPALLLKLLKDNGIQVDKKDSQQKTCEVMEQKETPTGFKDAPCDRAVEPGCAGLCKLHYMEYLVNLVNTHGLDPADILTIDQLKACLLRGDINIPNRTPRESEAAYRNRLLIEVKKLPLTRRTSDNA